MRYYAVMRLNKRDLTSPMLFNTPDSAKDFFKYAIGESVEVVPVELTVITPIARDCKNCENVMQHPHVEPCSKCLKDPNRPNFVSRFKESNND